MAFLLQVAIGSLPNYPQSCRSHLAYTRDLLQFFKRSIQHTSKGPKSFNQQFSRALHISTRDGQGQEKFNGLVIRKRFETAFEKALPKALTMAMIVWLGHIFPV